ncbi:MAG: LuxR C-terminal-related transcriptional regulator, partial [Spirochaetota bacterium]|nr:LuxR C-terminal-related transcriptional regulator [Spirochaetota bacterium]
VKFNNIQLTMELEAVKQRLSKLSKKQLQVIKFKSLGKTVDEIAKDLNTEPGTIHVHVSRALKKLQLPSLLPYLFNDNQD